MGRHIPDVVIDGVVHVSLEGVNHARKEALVDIIEMAKKIAREFDTTDMRARLRVEVILEGIGVPLPKVTELMKEVWPK